MKSPELDERTTASLQRRLLAAPAAVRAMATAETVDWRSPDFQTDEAQHAAMNALLRACADARAARLIIRLNGAVRSERIRTSSSAAASQPAAPSPLPRAWKSPAASANSPPMRHPTSKVSAREEYLPRHLRARLLKPGRYRELQPAAGER